MKFPAITEEQFSGQVEDLLKLYGWRWCHFRPAITEKGWRTALSGDKGLPDIIAVRPPRLIFAELKSEDGRLSPEQKEWLKDLDICRQATPFHKAHEVYLWRPSDYDEIEEILR